MPEQRLRDHALRVDAGFFVGRVNALAVVDRLLQADGDARILLVHGPGGIGKSALLRELRRRAEGTGRTVMSFDGRALSSGADLTRALTPPAGASGAVIVIDEAEALGATLLTVRDLLVDVLPADARLVVASRLRPDRAWLSGGLEDVSLELPLAPLDEEESRALLRERGVDDPETQDSILAWAGGSPLALTVAANTGARGLADSSASDLIERLIRYLAGTEIDGIDPAVLEVASLTWAVDARLIAAALPGRSTRHAMRELLALSVVEPLGHRAVLHPLLAQAVRTRLRNERPQHHRILLLRIAAHLKARARHNEAEALFELTNLLEDPAVRQGAGLGASQTHYTDALRHDDLEKIARLTGLDGTKRWDVLRRWFELLPQHSTSVRRADGAVTALALFAPPSAIPRGPIDDPGVAPVLDHLREHGLDPEQTLFGIGIMIADGLDPAEFAEVLRVGNTGIMARGGIVNVRHIYAQYWNPTSIPTDFLESMGYRSPDSLNRTVGDGTVTTWVSDFGPGGLVGFIHSLVLAENGEDAAAGEREAAPLLDRLREVTDDSAEAVRLALDAVFDDGPKDRKLRDVLELTYLSPALGEQAILARLHLSRATYYRRLREARERLS